MKWDQNNPEKVKDFIAKMKQDYAFKKAYAARRAWEFYNHPDVAGMCYVAVGGLDSITLFLFLRSIGIDVPGTSVSMLEDRSIQKVHKALGIRALRPANGPKDRPYTKIEVIREHGFPVLSKEIAGKISLLQHPSEKNATVRHAIMTGETGAYGGYRKNTRMKMSQKWLEKFGGPENEKIRDELPNGPVQGFRPVLLLPERKAVQRLRQEQPAVSVYGAYGIRGRPQTKGTYAERLQLH